MKGEKDNISRGIGPRIKKKSNFINTSYYSSMMGNS